MTAREPGPDGQLSATARGDALAKLAASPHLDRVRSLLLVWTDYPGQGWEQLFERPLPRLERLNLVCAGASPANLIGVAELALGRWPSVRALRLGLPRYLPEAELSAILRTLLPRLEDLTLHDAGLKAPALERLLAEPSVTGLRRLGLTHNRELGDAGLRALAASPRLGGLKALDLEAVGAGPDGLAALADSPHLGALEELSLCGNAVGAAGAEALGRSPRMATLRALDLTTCGVGPRGVAALAEGEAPRPLERLRLRFSRTGAAGARSLAGSRSLVALRELDLSYAHLDDDALEALAGSPVLASVEVLNIQDNAIHERGVLALAASPHLGKLREFLPGDSALSSTLSAAGMSAARASPWEPVRRWARHSLPRAIPTLPPVPAPVRLEEARAAVAQAGAQTGAQALAALAGAGLLAPGLAADPERAFREELYVTCSECRGSGTQQATGDACYPCSGWGRILTGKVDHPAPPDVARALCFATTPDVAGLESLARELAGALALGPAQVPTRLVWRLEPRAYDPRRGMTNLYQPAWTALGRALDEPDMARGVSCEDWAAWLELCWRRAAQAGLAPFAGRDSPGERIQALLARGFQLAVEEGALLLEGALPGG